MLKFGDIEGLCLHPLDVIKVDGGDVMHGMKRSDSGYIDFGEAYFSIINFGAIKGWKRKKKMTLNLMVPHGAVKFVFIDRRMNSPSIDNFQEIVLSKNQYGRITVAPGIWFGFQGIKDPQNIVLNIADIEHDWSEVDNLPLSSINYGW